MYSNLVYEKKLQHVRVEVGNHFIYLQVEETTDTLGRLITYAIVAPLIADIAGIPRIIHCAEIPRANTETIVGFVESSLTKLWPDRIRREKVLLFISDAASYMMAAGRLLKQNHHYNKLFHVSCLAHGLHRVAEEIRVTYGLVNDVIAEAKAVFTKSPMCKRLFCQIAPGIPLPPKPIVTNWGELLKAASYYSTYFKAVQAVIEELQPDAAVAECAQELWENPILQQNFQFIQEHYCLITGAITRLEERGLPLQDFAQIFTDVAASIQRNPVISANIKLKIQNVFLNNTGFSIDLINICRSLQGQPNPIIPNG